MTPETCDDVNMGSADEFARREKEQERRRELSREAKERQLKQAVNTLGVLSIILIPGTHVDQDVYYTALDEHGLEQKAGETTNELQDRAAALCRASGMSAKEVAGIFLTEDSRLYTAFHLGSISAQQRDSIKASLTIEIAVVYTRSVQPKKV